MADDVLTRLETLTAIARQHRGAKTQGRLVVTAASGPDTRRLLARLSADGFEVEWIRKAEPGEPTQMELF